VVVVHVTTTILHLVSVPCLPSGFLFILADNVSPCDFLRADFVVLCVEQV
jgi:hypothetical protein